ncbi:MAG: hypothetical protein LBF58_12555 [Deltaproteobacteria bacterium]|jgi:hypothetical protein|nr:hypothetical protein [Deltaproteobacteria bacterium]
MKRFLPRFIAALFLGLSLLGAVAIGQDDYDPFWGLRPTIGAELPNLKTSSSLDKYIDPTCKEFTNEVGVSYPVNTGSAQVDAALASIGEKIYREYYNNDMGGCPDEPFTSNTESYSRTSYRANSPSKNYLSVLFTTNAMGAGAAHGHELSKGYLFDLRTGRSLDLNDIIADTRLAMPGLWNVMTYAWCGLGFGELPDGYDLPYDSKSCENGPPYPMPKKLIRARVSLEDLGGVLFTPKGLTIRLDSPYSYADGPQEISINKRGLESLGFKSDLWD